MTPLAIRFAAALAALLFVINAAAPMLGSGQPPREANLGDIGFAACQLPCWAGITPGQTPLEDARTLLAAHLPNFTVPMLVMSSTLAFQTVSAEPALSGVLYYDGNQVSEVHLEIALPMRYLLDALGTPDCVWVAGGNPQRSLIVFWERGDLSTGALVDFDGRMAWNSAMRARSLLMSAIQSCDTPGVLPWMGFAPAWRYAAERGISIAAP